MAVFVPVCRSPLSMTWGHNAAATGCLVRELKANREEEGEDELDKRFGIAQEGKVGRLIVEIDGNRTILASRFGGLSHESPSVEMAVGADETS